MPGVTSKSMYSFGYKNPIINIQGVSTTLEDGNAAKKVRDPVWVLGIFCMDDKSVGQNFSDDGLRRSNSASFSYGAKEIHSFSTRIPFTLKINRE